MKVQGWILTILFISLPLFSAQANECIPQSDMAEIGRDFSQFRHLTRSEFCLDGTPESNLLVGIYFMRKTSFENSMAQADDGLFSGKFASDWYRYFTGRISDIVIDRNCPPGVGAYVRGWGSTMWVCSLMLTDAFVGMDRASVFMHEARHIDGYPHTTCRSGPRAGIRGACDRRISDGGSYAVSVETYAQLGRYATNLHPALMAYSKAAAVIYAEEAFDEKTEIDRTPHFLALTKDKSFHRMNFDQEPSYEKLGSAPHLGHLIMRGQFMMMLPDDKSHKAGYVLANNEGPLPHSPRAFAKDYNNSSPSERAALIDAHVGGNWAAQVKSGELLIKCESRSDRGQTLSYQGEEPLTVIYPNGYSRHNLSAHLMMRSGKIFEFGCNRKRGYLHSTQLELDQKYKRVYKSGRLTIGLTSDGNLYKIDGTGSIKISTQIDGQIHDIAPAESFKFFDGV